MNFYLFHGSVDMRKSIVSLSELVRRRMNTSPENGDVFIFLGKERRILKILHHEFNSYVLYLKKLDREHFLLPMFNADTYCYEVARSPTPRHCSQRTSRRVFRATKNTG